ncbi:uncharacterized protein LOC128787294 isoform X1 [Vidua chalybeata]|uniref:uncharacterized protein LOC128787294 isoform X1 n=1 Tax=Vidua chalybeata TaxID=81927 RepID=UPI0023A9005E|nr:uncharacterized protein LOC128787294 isoform X1 [Vidua chalybeata]
MQRTAELPAAPSPFWSLLALLRREPGMGWLPCCPGDCTGSCGTSGLEADSEEGAADKLSQVPEKHSLGPWPLKALLLLEDSRERHLWQVYHEGLKNFLSFREGMALSAVWPIPIEQIRDFLVTMESQDLPPTKIIMYMEGLSFISRMVDHPDPLPDPLVCYMMSRVKQRISRSNDEYSPVTIEVLRSLLGTLESVCSSPYECMLFRAIFTVAFFGVLHIEQMVANHQNIAQPGLLNLSDLQLTEGHATLSLHPSYVGQQRCLIQLRLRKEMWVCPVEALRIYVAARPRGEGPLFVHSNSMAVTKREFLTVFHCGLRFAGLPPNQYAVHSFWLGNPNRRISWVSPQSWARLE